LIDGARYDIPRQLLRDTQLTVAGIAAALGCSGRAANGPV
jgi:hypothetical protein